MGALSWGRGADFEAPAAVGVAHVRRAPIEPEEVRLPLKKVAATHALLRGSALRRGRAAALDVAHAGLVHGALGRRENDVVRVADRLEDVHAADARLPRNVHGPVWQLRAVDHHLCEAGLRSRLVPLLHGQRPRAALPRLGEQDLVDLVRKVELDLALRALGIEGQELPVERRRRCTRVAAAAGVCGG